MINRLIIFLVVGGLWSCGIKGPPLPPLNEPPAPQIVSEPTPAPTPMPVKKNKKKK